MIKNFGKRKRLYVILLVIETLLIFSSVIGVVSALKNGKEATGHFDAYSPTFVSDWWANGKHYGSHDWVAQAALEAVKTDAKWMNGDTPFWNARRETIFLIGTEAPDTSGLNLYGSLNGISVRGISNTGYHHLYFHDTDVLPAETRMKPRFWTLQLSRPVIRTTKEIQSFLKEGKCDLAAFYLGHIAHYITDMVNFLSVLQTNVEVDVETSGECERMHNRFETALENAMNKPNERNIAFTYSTSFTVQPLGIHPWECVKTVAFDTRWDLEVDNIDFVDTTTLTPGSQNAVWFYTSFRSWTDALPSTQKTTINDWPSDLKTRVNALLQQAIKYTANAINFVADSWAELGDVGISKHCDDCNEGNENVLDQSTKVVKYASMMVASLAFMGLALANILPIVFIVVPLAAKGKELTHMPFIGG